jgi:hypothetical protein
MMSVGTLGVVVVSFRERAYPFISAPWSPLLLKGAWNEVRWESNPGVQARRLKRRHMTSVHTKVHTTATRTMMFVLYLPRNVCLNGQAHWSE